MQLPNPGEVLLGKYRVEEVIGVGGMGQVVKASHLYLQQYVAIKIMLPEMVDSQSTIARFLREAQSTVRLRSEHIARVMDVGTMPDGRPFMVMEFLEGHDLNQILRHHGPQMPQAVVDLVLQACEGIAEAHAIGIIHRDIKPSNFFITRRPDGSNLLKILDFGISKTPAEMSEITGTQTVIGTPTYMAPEQMVSARSTDPRSDIWSIGVVMYQLLAGRPPFEAETYAQLVLKVGTAAPAPMHVSLPPGLQDIVLRCLEKDPNQRIQNVGDLARVLAPYASDPMSAQQSAERAARILTSPRSSSQGIVLGGNVGGLSMTPPAAQTPGSWGKTDASSLSGGAGQLATKVTRGGRRGLVIAGVATLCIVAGVGGFFVASSMRSESKPTATVEQSPVEMKHPMQPNTPADSGSAATGSPATGSAATGSAAATTPAKTDAKTDAKTTANAETKSDSTSDPEKKIESAPEQKTDTDSKSDSSKTSHSTRSSRTKTEKPGEKKEKDLFDERR